MGKGSAKGVNCAPEGGYILNERGSGTIKIQHVVMFSTGLSSAILLDMVHRAHGKENTVALFTDTLWEDEDNYRFCDEVIGHLGANLVYRKDGRTPEQVWFKDRFIASPKGSRCTITLKVKQTLKYLEELSTKGIQARLYFGIGAKESHRAPGLTYRYAPIECDFPLIDQPMNHEQMKYVCENDWNIRIPRMYELGFSHANCGGRCVKGGHKHFKQLYKVWPDKYMELEEIERQFRERVNSNIAVLKDRRGGKTRYMTLEEFRERVILGGQQCGSVTDHTPCECFF